MISLTISIITITTCIGLLELSPWLCTCVVFIFSAILVVRVPFPFGVWGRMWNSIVSVPDHCLLSTLHIRAVVFVPCCGPEKSPCTFI